MAFYQQKNPVQAFLVVSVETTRKDTDSAEIKCTLDDGRIVSPDHICRARYIQSGDYYFRLDYSATNSVWYFATPEDFEAQYAEIIEQPA